MAFGPSMFCFSMTVVPVSAMVVNNWSTSPWQVAALAIMLYTCEGWNIFCLLDRRHVIFYPVICVKWFYIIPILTSEYVLWLVFVFTTCVPFIFYKLAIVKIAVPFRLSASQYCLQLKENIQGRALNADANWNGVSALMDTNSRSWSGLDINANVTLSFRQAAFIGDPIPSRNWSVILLIDGAHFLRMGSYISVRYWSVAATTTWCW